LHPERLEHVDHGHAIDAAGMRIEVLHTPGHTRGSVCFVVDGMCFAGDTVFRGNLGHTTYPGGSKRSLRESIRSKLLPLPDDVRVLPGHGADTTVGDERRLWERET
ncbi:MAG: MBL fold metallo-hydrolase, partial [Candidatus Binatia bacterium]